MIIKITDSKRYNDFIKDFSSGHFMQTTYWADFKAQFGWQNLGQYIIEEEGKIKAGFSALKRSRYGINIFYIPRGPNWDLNDRKLTEYLFDEIKKLAKKEKAFFVRISPPFLVNNQEAEDILKEHKFKFSKKQLQTKATIIIDLTRTEEELLNSFHPKTRYNIKLAQKKGVVVEKLKDEKELDALYIILKNMAKRQNYILQDKSYYQYIWQNLQDISTSYIAKNKEGILIGGVVVFHFAGKSYYMYGGFDFEYRNLMGNYAIHWQIMLEAKARGDKHYDMQGVPLIKDESHPMYGFYRFKKGFNGEEIEFIGEYDYPVNKLLYWLWNNIKFEKNLYLQ